MTEGEFARIDWGKGGGLVPAIVQDTGTLQVLMLGYMSREALEATLRDGLVTFFSRSRGELWRKGTTSGNVLELKSVSLDCDGDTLLISVAQRGPTCHLRTQSCFAEAPMGEAWLEGLTQIVHSRRDADPETSYTARLLRDGPVRVAQKVGEEGVEVALAGAALDREACVEEVADLIFHTAVLMELREFGWSDVSKALATRTKVSVA